MTDTTFPKYPNNGKYLLQQGNNICNDKNDNCQMGNFY